MKRWAKATKMNLQIFTWHTRFDSKFGIDIILRKNAFCFRKMNTCEYLLFNLEIIIQDN